MLFSLTVSSNFSVRLLCCSIWMLRSCISLWISCRYCNLYSVGYSLYVDQIMVVVLRMYSNLIVVVYYEMIVLDIVNQDL